MKKGGEGEGSNEGREGGSKQARKQRRKEETEGRTNEWMNEWFHYDNHEWTDKQENARSNERPEVYTELVESKKGIWIEYFGIVY